MPDGSTQKAAYLWEASRANAELALQFWLWRWDAPGQHDGGFVPI